MRKFQRLMLLWIITLLAFNFMMATPVFSGYPPRFYDRSGRGAATMYVDPQEVVFDTPPPNGTWFTINIRIANATCVAMWQIEILYKKTLLYTSPANISYAADHIFPPGKYSPVTPTVDSFNTTHNYILHSAISLPYQEYNTTDAGLTTMKFQIIKVLGPGEKLSSFLYFTVLPETPGLFGSFTLDIDLNENDLTVKDGFYEIKRPPPPPAALYVDPPKKIDPTLDPCTNFTINVNIKNATNLRQLAFKLGFNSTLLNVVNATLGPFLPPTTVYIIEINNTQGYVKYSAKVDPPEPPLNGNGTLAEITFHVESLGFCNLTLTETDLIDDVGDPIPHSTKDGYFNNMMLAKIAVQPPEIKDPTLLPPQTFEINVTIAEVADLYGYAFKLSYDPAILIALQVTIHEIFGEVYYIPNFSVDNTNGIVQVSVQYYEPANPISTTPPITVVTIKFRVKGRGITALDLYDTSLTDSAGQPITHEARDGLFANVRRDIALINVVRDRTEVYAGWIVNINVTAMNQGDLNETFDVEVYYGTNSSVGTLTFTHVGPNETVTQTIQWNTRNVPACQNYTISAEAVALPYETDLADNFFTDSTVKIWLMGDVNHDRKVDGKDVALVSKAFASYPGHPRWDPSCDLNQDNKIDGKDIAKIAANFGKRC